MLSRYAHVQTGDHKLLFPFKLRKRQVHNVNGKNIDFVMLLQGWKHSFRAQPGRRYRSTCPVEKCADTIKAARAADNAACTDADDPAARLCDYGIYACYSKFTTKYKITRFSAHLGDHI